MVTGKMRNLFREGLEYYRRHWKLLLSIAVTYYGLVFVVGLLVALTPGGGELQETLIQQAGSEIETALPGLLEAYLNNPILAVGYTFVINLVLGTVLWITIPGLILFVLAPLTAFYRAMAWGIIFAPTQPSLVILVLPTLLSEGLGYVLAVVPSMRLGMSWLLPKLAFKQEALSRGQAFRKAFYEMGHAYLIVIIALLAAAIIEVGSVQLLILLVGRA